MCGQDEILAAAHQLTDIPGVYTDNSCAPVTYYHILLADHEMLESAGISCESLHPGESPCRRFHRTRRKNWIFWCLICHIADFTTSGRCMQAGDRSAT